MDAAPRVRNKGSRGSLGFDGLAAISCGRSTSSLNWGHSAFSPAELMKVALPNPAGASFPGWVTRLRLARPVSSRSAVGQTTSSAPPCLSCVGPHEGWHTTVSVLLPIRGLGQALVPLQSLPRPRSSSWAHTLSSCSCPSSLLIYNPPTAISSLFHRLTTSSPSPKESRLDSDTILRWWGRMHTEERERSGIWLKERQCRCVAKSKIFLAGCQSVQ